MTSRTMADFLKPAPERPLSLATHAHSRDGLPGWGTRPVTHPVIPRGPVRLADEDTAQFIRDQETYRMRTRPELYDERDLHEADTLRQHLVPDGHWDWDCRTCKAAVIAPIGAMCPRCGRE